MFVYWCLVRMATAVVGESLLRRVLGCALTDALDAATCFDSDLQRARPHWKTLLESGKPCFSRFSRMRFPVVMESPPELVGGK